MSAIEQLAHQLLQIAEQNQEIDPLHQNNLKKEAEALIALTQKVARINQGSSISPEALDTMLSEFSLKTQQTITEQLNKKKHSNSAQSLVDAINSLSQTKTHSQCSHPKRHY